MNLLKGFLLCYPRTYYKLGSTFILNLHKKITFWYKHVILPFLILCLSFLTDQNYPFPKKKCLSWISSFKKLPNQQKWLLDSTCPRSNHNTNNPTTIRVLWNIWKQLLPKINNIHCNLCQGSRIRRVPSQSTWVSFFHDQS